MAKKKMLDLLGIHSDPKSYFGASSYERAASRFSSHIARDRNPAGYERFLMQTYARNAAAEAVAAAAKKEEEKPEEPVQEPEVVQETPPTFTPTVLDTGESSNPALFINRFGGNKETMAHSGLKAVKAAEAAGLSIGEIQQMAAAQGVQFGIGAQEYFKEQQGPSPQDMFASQISAMQQMFQQSMQQQQQQYMQMQQAQEERMAVLQQQMQQAMVAQQTRPEVAGVKMATGSAGTPMQIARRGVTGAFGRRGMRISALNV